MLTPTITAQIDRELGKYPPEQKQAAVISALRIVQAEAGWLSQESISAVARYLGIPDIAAQEVASFYNMFNLKPCGRYKITVCTNISCALRGADNIVHHLQQRLGIGFNQTSTDGKFHLKEGECMGACGGAPLLIVNNTTMHEHLDAAKIDALLESLQ